MILERFTQQLFGNVKPILRGFEDEDLCMWQLWFGKGFICVCNSLLFFTVCQKISNSSVDY